jgi:large subunit ribosomal protein L31
MKKGLHPELVDCTFKCTCGATFVAKSNKEVQNVEVCNECHPFYTGKQGKAKKTGAVEKFNKKFGYNNEAA